MKDRCHVFHRVSLPISSGFLGSAVLSGPATLALQGPLTTLFLSLGSVNIIIPTGAAWLGGQRDFVLVGEVSSPNTARMLALIGLVTVFTVIHSNFALRLVHQRQRSSGELGKWIRFGPIHLPLKEGTGEEIGGVTKGIVYIHKVQRIVDWVMCPLGRIRDGTKLYLLN